MSGEQNPIDIPCKSCQVPLTPIDKAAGKYTCPSCKKPYQLTNRAPSRVLNCKECGGLPCSRIASPDGDPNKEWFQCENCNKKYRRTTTVTYKQEQKQVVQESRVKTCCVAGCGAECRRAAFCFMHLCRLCFNQLPQAGAVHCGCACNHPSFCYNPKASGSAYCIGHQCPKCPNAKPGEDADCGCSPKVKKAEETAVHHSVAVPVQHFYIPQGAAAQWGMGSAGVSGMVRTQSNMQVGAVAGPAYATGPIRTQSNMHAGMLAASGPVSGGVIRTMSNLQGGFIPAGQPTNQAGTIHAVAAAHSSSGQVHAISSMAGPQHAEY